MEYLCVEELFVLLEVEGVAVKMLEIELHDRRGKLFVMLCLYVYSYSYRHVSHILYIYESTQLCLYYLFCFISIAGYDIYIK